MQADNLGRFALVEMTSSGIADGLPQFSQGVTLRENGLTEGARSETTLRRFFHQKNEFVHDLRANHAFTLVWNFHDPLLFGKNIVG